MLIYFTDYLLNCNLSFHPARGTGLLTSNLLQLKAMIVPTGIGVLNLEAGSYSVTGCNCLFYRLRLGIVYHLFAMECKVRNENSAIAGGLTAIKCGSRGSPWVLVC
jgi:hypothetical protein